MKHAALALALFALHASLFAQGPLNPSAPPGPTMKSLDQIEARTAITNTASLVTISQARLVLFDAQHYRQRRRCH